MTAFSCLRLVLAAAAAIALLGTSRVEAGEPYPHAGEPIGTVREVYDGRLYPDLAVNTFRNIDRLFPTRTVAGDPAARPLPETLPLSPAAMDDFAFESGGQRYLDRANFARYDTAVAVFEGLDSRRLVSTYVRFHPLLDQAYREVGVPGKTFNDRLVEVIEHLLAAPEPGANLALVPVEGRPRWAFADPRLEQGSIGHKALWRMGPDHAVRVKAKLAELRELLAAQPPRG